MGFALDVASIEGLDKDEALRRLGYVAAGSESDGIGGDVSWATTSNGRVVLVADYGWLEPARLTELSRGASLVAGRFETHVGDSNAWGYRDGARIWSVQCNNEESHYGDEYGLTVDGVPPAEFAVIRDRLLAERRAEADTDEEPDEDLYDLPEELVETLGGWTPEGENSEDLQFFAAAWDGPVEERGPGFFGRLFKGFGRSR